MRACSQILTRRHAVNVFAAVDVGLGDFVKNAGHLLVAFIENVDETVGVPSVLGDEERNVLFDVGHSHSIEIETEIDGKVGVDDIIQIGQLLKQPITVRRTCQPKLGHAESVVNLPTLLLTTSLATKTLLGVALKSKNNKKCLCNPLNLNLSN